MKRYDPEISCGPPCVAIMEETKDGQWVRACDLEELILAARTLIKECKNYGNSDGIGLGTAIYNLQCMLEDVT